MQRSVTTRLTLELGSGENYGGVRGFGKESLALQHRDLSESVKQQEEHLQQQQQLQKQQQQQQQQRQQHL